MSYSSEVLADSPLVYLRLGESSGTSAVDSSGNALNGTYSNVALGVAGALSGDANTAANFVRTNSGYISLGASPSLNLTQLTYEAWLRPASMPGRGFGTDSFYSIMGKGDGATTEQCILRIDNEDSGPKIHFGSWAGSMSKANYDVSGWTLNEWHHVVATVASNVWKIYVDGVQVASETRSANASSEAGAFIIGGAIPGSGNPVARFFDGRIDEVAVYSGALSAGRVLAHYNAGIGAVSNPPNAPTSLVATTSSSTQINMIWTDNSSDETGFEVERSANGTTGWTLIASPSTNINSYYNTGLTPSTQYFYRVRAVNANGNSAYSNVADATTSAPPSTPPTAPTSLTATAASSSAINIAWTDNSSDETGFELERSANGTTGWTLITTKAANVTTHSDTGLTAETAYYYRLRAVNAAGNSSYSNTDDATTLASGGGPVLASAIVLAEDSTFVELQFSEDVTGVNLADYTFKINGVARRASSITTPWWSNAVRRFNFAKRWIHKNEVVTVNYTGTATVTTAASTPIPTVSNLAVTNNSIVLERAAAHVGRRLGMFLHWGMNTFTGLEWGDGTESPSTFAPPTNPNMIDNWIASAKAMGATYMVLTTKHHDGFCLWPSAVTNHSLSGAPWYTTNGGFNIVQEFVTRCNAAGIAPCLYFSVWDRNYDANNFGASAQATTDFTKAQIGEILSYGPVNALWTDGWGSRNNYGVNIFAQIYDHIKALQPGCVLIENNHIGDISKSDMAVFEAGVNGSVPSTNIWPGEGTDSISDMGWFWKSNETLKSSAAIISEINTTNSRRCSYLLNCPPNQQGIIPDATAALMSVIGNEVALQSYDERTSTIGGSSTPRMSVF